MAPKVPQTAEVQAPYLPSPRQQTPAGVAGGGGETETCGEWFSHRRVPVRPFIMWDRTLKRVSSSMTSLTDDCKH